MFVVQVMCRDAVHLKTSSTTKEVGAQERDNTIDINDVTMEQIWTVHKLVASCGLEKEFCTLASEMVQ